ncbi:ABC transporter substrate-binding protein [Streptomyces sp. CBMA29]|uniref:ABC transporter substrate-binding protein n=1 Tax=Streptomyces sp. CBMA29 TaxID=1896314 RepID=UPI001661D5DA|nr:extracellular solute-binding protein [Streptomyces sp. CBMA29]MBD0734222.1 ABC transporter substrate-binding protein [Streptomyces sp. CBMA29]
MRHGALTAGVLAAGLVLVGCGSSPATGGGSARPTSDPYSAYASLTGKERTDKLLADAKSQGNVLDLYTSNTDIQDLVDGFKTAYPGIKVNAFRANSETVLQRILQEDKANKTQTDVVDTNDSELRSMDKQQVLTPYDGPSKAGLRASATTFGGWTAERFNAFVVGWNTDVIPGGKPPVDFTDLADPKWKGKLSVEVGDWDWDWYASMHTYLTDDKGMSPADVDALFKKIIANSKVTKGHTVQGELLSAGQFGVALSVYSHTIDKAAKKGAPVAWRPTVQPVILRPNGVGMLSRARHPAAAMLWTDWVLSDGQRLIAKSLRIPAAETVEGFTDPIPAGSTTYNVPESAEKDTAKWNAAYDALLRGVAKTG